VAAATVASISRRQQPKKKQKGAARKSRFAPLAVRGGACWRFASFAYAIPPAAAGLVQCREPSVCARSWRGGASELRCACSLTTQRGSIGTSVKEACCKTSGRPSAQAIFALEELGKTRSRHRAASLWAAHDGSFTLPLGFYAARIQILKNLRFFLTRRCVDCSGDYRMMARNRGSIACLFTVLF
jgi:hypothetical protein